jgi:hypothetical protein
MLSPQFPKLYRIRLDKNLNGHSGRYQRVGEPAISQEMADAPNWFLELAAFRRRISHVPLRGTQPAQLCAGNCRSSHAADPLRERARGLTPLFDTITFEQTFGSRGIRTPRKC